MPLSTRFCDGISRRSSLQLGLMGLGAASGLASGGLSLADLFASEGQAGSGNKKSVILIYLSGGLAHQDSFDLKPDAPAEVRGEFRPIDTTVPGFQICELLPELAQVADQYSVIRSLVGQRDEHSSFQTCSGYTMGETQRDQLPHFGSVVSKVLGPLNPIVPPFVDLFPTMQHRPYNSPGPGKLGPQYAGTRADGEDLASMKLRYIPAEQLSHRRALLQQFDTLRRERDTVRVASAEANYQRAFDVLTSSQMVDALDVSREDPQVRARYGASTSKHQGDGAPLWNDQLIMARRLVEAGVRCVTVAYGFWDTHGNNFGHLRGNLPVFDRGIASLIRDLKERGLDQDTMVVVWGEFGRTPKINKDAGRDHWARVNSALVAGGGLRMGQVIGSTDKLGDSAKDRPVFYQDLLATIYHTLGVDIRQMVRDATQSPFLLLPSHVSPIRELLPV